MNDEEKLYLQLRVIDVPMALLAGDGSAFFCLECSTEWHGHFAHMVCECGSEHTAWKRPSGSDYESVQPLFSEAKRDFFIEPLLQRYINSDEEVYLWEEIKSDLYGQMQIYGIALPKNCCFISRDVYDYEDGTVTNIFGDVLFIDEFDF